ncbi:unnamed protein product [Aphanomyces euteiches]|uniref:AB hydrolase-1 domain-containing protein n=1 Tax=Aphanomyces euteiches TaxID=100861 RepID=A0A6G0WR70_9STRA|nr:hypothetical protein Ae201684_012592 [Aphanomyces euteiches]KAH9090609.1 hypothetical protein Ae201684P_014405 [Aphanomyces euteiches]KAH9155890.1 hypothetical protein AeRB84_002168 [Aphanomyces euteiches]
MRLFLATAIAALASASSLKAGWFHCPLFTPSTNGASGGGAAARAAKTLGKYWSKHDLIDRERIHARKSPQDDQDAVISPHSVPASTCASFEAPLCYPGLCDSSKSVNVYAKRIEATSPPPPGQRPTAVWFLQGGPGESSYVMDTLMRQVYTLFNGSVSVYTMDHRGTGRSTYLDCPTVGASSGGSENSTTITPHELPECLAEVRATYGKDVAAGFGTTAAASDLKMLIEALNEGHDTFVYGVSYGTFLVHRLMQLAPTNVKGYIFDSVVGPGTPHFSQWSVLNKPVADLLLSYCSKDSYCRKMLLGQDAHDVLQRILNRPNGQVCGDLTAYDLRAYLYMLLQAGAGARDFIPAIIHRADRCTENDQIALHNIQQAFMPPSPRPSFNFVDVDNSKLMYYDIIFSELWEQPTPSLDEMKRRMDANLMGTDMADYVTVYCYFTNSQDPACRDIPKANAPFVYPVDKYGLAKSTTIPNNASVLILNGDLDPQTPPQGARVLLNRLQGGKKRLITFPDAAHATVMTTPVKTEGMVTCGMNLVAQFIYTNGDVASLDLACKADLVNTTFQIPPETAMKIVGAKDAYNGRVSRVKATTMSSALNESNSNDEELKVGGLIVVCIVGTLVLMAVVIQDVKKAKRAAKEKATDATTAAKAQDTAAKTEYDPVTV